MVKCLPAPRGDGFNHWVGENPWRRKWQPTPVLLPEKFHGQRSLVGYSPLGRKGSDTTEFTYLLKTLRSCCMMCKGLAKIMTVCNPRNQSIRLLCPQYSSGKNTGVSSHSLFQGILQPQGSNPGLLHCRQSLYCLSHHAV